MIVTSIGYFYLLVGAAIALRGSLRQAFLFLFVSGLFSGSAALILLGGGSSVPPLYFALPFVYFRILAPRGGFLHEIPDAFRANRWLVLFALYSLSMAYVGPRLFAGAIDVYQMRMVDPESRFDTLPLGPTSQNLTAGIYMIGTLFIAIAVWIASRRENSARTLVTAIIGVTWAHIAFGLLGLAARGTQLDALLDVFRNSAYDQLNADVVGMVRIRGISPEASEYAGIGFGYLVANAELWYRSVRSGATGTAALAMAVVLFFSTSSTAYAGLAIYAAFFIARALIVPGLASGTKVRTLLATIGGFCFLSAILAAVAPDLAASIFKIIKLMTVEKSSSGSGEQRLFWALQGWDAFRVSYGLGIGPGSFRSSSLFLAILGSVGVIGIISFILYLNAVFQPWRRSSWGPGGDLRPAVGGAFASAAMLSLIPAALSSATAYPGPNFVIFAGAALALRPRLTRSKEAQEDAEGNAVVGNEIMQRLR